MHVIAGTLRGSVLSHTRLAAATLLRLAFKQSPPHRHRLLISCSQSEDIALQSALATAYALMPVGSTALAAFSTVAAAQIGEVCSIRCTVEDEPGASADELADALLGCGAQSTRYANLGCLAPTARTLFETCTVRRGWCRAVSLRCLPATAKRVSRPAASRSFGRRARPSSRCTAAASSGACGTAALWSHTSRLTQTSRLPSSVLLSGPGAASPYASRRVSGPCASQLAHRGLQCRGLKCYVSGSSS